MRQHGQRAPDRVDVGGHRRADVRHLGRLVARRAVDRGVEVVEAAHAAEVDQLDRVADLDDVVGLEVAVEQVEVVQVLERGQDLDDEGDRLVDRERVVHAAGRPHPLLEQLLERRAADVLHHDVAGALVRHEVVDLDDERVLDLGEELPLGDGRGERVGVAGVQQALEHDPAVGDVAVAGEVDPAEAAVGEAPATSYWPPTRSPALQLGGERERGAALRAEALGAARLAVAGAADRRRRRWGRCGGPPAPSGSPGSPWRASTAGTGGIEVRPAPSRAPRSRVEDVPTRRVTLLPPAAARAEPSAVDASRFEARETVEGDWPAGGHRRDRDPVAATVPPGAPTGPSGRASRRRRSSRRRSVPVHPGCVHRPAAPVDADGGARRGGLARARGRGRRRRRSSRRGCCRCSRAGCRQSRSWLASCVGRAWRRCSRALPGRPGRPRGGRGPRTRSAGSPVERLAGPPLAGRRGPPRPAVDRREARRLGGLGGVRLQLTLQLVALGQRRGVGVLRHRHRPADGVEPDQVGVHGVRVGRHRPERRHVGHGEPRRRGDLGHAPRGEVAKRRAAGLQLASRSARARASSCGVGPPGRRHRR